MLKVFLTSNFVGGFIFSWIGSNVDRLLKILRLLNPAVAMELTRDRKTIVIGAPLNQIKLPAKFSFTESNHLTNKSTAKNGQIIDLSSIDSTWIDNDCVKLWRFVEWLNPKHMVKLANNNSTLVVSCDAEDLRLPKPFHYIANYGITNLNTSDDGRFIVLKVC